MRNRIVLSSVVLAFAAALSGCVTAYRWTSPVPERLRTVAVPTFRNNSDVTELGDVVSRQVLREIQREGTFKIRRLEDAAIEIQGVVRGGSVGYSAGDRRSGMRLAESTFELTADVSVIDRTSGRVLIDNRRYTAVTTFVSGQDMFTAMRDASGRAADDLAMQIVDDLTVMQL